MSGQDYEAKRPGREIEYREAYAAWLATMTPAERAAVESMGVDRPHLDNMGAGGPELDMERLAEVESGEPLGASSGEGATASDLLALAVGEMKDSGNPSLTLLALARVLLDPEITRRSWEDLAEEAGVDPDHFKRECMALAQMLGIDANDSGEAIRARGVLRAILGDILALRNRKLTIDCLSFSLKICYEGESQTSIAVRHTVKRATVSKRCVAVCDRLGIEPPAGMRSKKACKNYKDARIKSHGRTATEKARAAFEARRAAFSAREGQQ